jgi:hypothetical protein
MVLELTHTISIMWGFLTYTNKKSLPCFFMCDSQLPRFTRQPELLYGRGVVIENFRHRAVFLLLVNLSSFLT